jgi:hypothetical protein
MYVKSRVKLFGPGGDQAVTFFCAYVHMLPFDPRGVLILFGKCPGDFRSRTAEEYQGTLATSKASHGGSAAGNRLEFSPKRSSMPFGSSPDSDARAATGGRRGYRWGNLCGGVFPGFPSTAMQHVWPFTESSWWIVIGYFHL